MGYRNTSFIKILIFAALFSSCGHAPDLYDSEMKGLFAVLEGDQNVPERTSGKKNRHSTVKSSSVKVSKRSQIQIRWPLRQVSVTSEFGERGKKFHEGVDLKAAVGTPIYAAHRGVVLFAGTLKGYGRVTVLRHESGISTVYAHASRLVVKKFDKIKLGQKIALSGATGRVSGPHLHFEVRDKVHPVDPVALIDQNHIVAHR